MADLHNQNIINEIKAIITSARENVARQINNAKIEKFLLELGRGFVSKTQLPNTYNYDIILRTLIY